MPLKGIVDLICPRWFPTGSEEPADASAKGLLIKLAAGERLIPIHTVSNGLRLGVNIDHVATLR
ncbi:MAG: hypothetical protein QOG27_338, partial [Verrucomicrobiota bacterium]